MPIVGLEAVVYGVEDVPLCTRFFTDFGLDAVESNDRGATLSVAGEGTRVTLREIEDPSLPPPVEPGSTLREVVWAVTDAAALAAIETELARDRNVHIDAAGILHVIGPSGFGIAFELTRAARELAPPAGGARVANSRVAGYQRAVPDHLGHIGLFTPEMDADAAFYRERLGFTMSDSIRGFGKFMRAPGSINHHNILFANRPRSGMQHLSLRLRDLDEIGAGMRFLERQGWRRIWGPGRHRPGSDIFVFFVNPAGGLVEYHFDEDFIVDPTTWVPVEFEPQNISLWGDRPPAEMGAPPELARSTG